MVDGLRVAAAAAQRWAPPGFTDVSFDTESDDLGSRGHGSRGSTGVVGTSALVAKAPPLWRPWLDYGVGLTQDQSKSPIQSLWFQ